MPLKLIYSPSPYIEPKYRPKLNPHIDTLASAIATEPADDAAYFLLLRYCLRRTALKTIDFGFGSIRYWLIAIVTGVFANIAYEIHRRAGTLWGTTHRDNVDYSAIEHKYGKRVNPLIDRLAVIITLETNGDTEFAGLLNYSLTRTATKSLKLRFPNIYSSMINAIEDIFRDLSEEFNKDPGTPYEDAQIERNGDVDTLKELVELKNRL